jgi:hypothetical protein
MLQDISKVAGSGMSIASYACFGAALYAGRKFCLSAACNTMAVAEGLIGREEAAVAWEKTGQDYWTLAKKDAVRDLTAVGGFVVLGLASGCAGKALSVEEKPLAEEQGFYEYYGTPILRFQDRLLSTLWDYKKTVAAATITSSAVLLAAAYTARKELGELAIFVIREIDQNGSRGAQKQIECITEWTQ